MTRSTLRWCSHPAVAACAVVAMLTACGGQNTPATGGGSGGDGDGALSGLVLVDGSSTVEPLSSAAAELFDDVHPGVNVSVATSGTGGGFAKFCAGETDISNASRPISDSEAADCQTRGIEYVELQLANDALTVVVNPENTWADCLTVEQLRTIWAPESEGQITNWNQVDPSFPDEPLALFGPGTDSGTFDYFTDEINGAEGASRPDFQASEDDNVLVQGVAGARGAIAYFGYTYFEENQDRLTAVRVDNGAGCVPPSAETVQDGSYTPLARPLFIYVNKASYQDKPQVKGFVDFYVADASDIASAARFVPLSPEQTEALHAAAAELG